MELGTGMGMGMRTGFGGLQAGLDLPLAGFSGLSLAG